MGEKEFIFPVNKKGVETALKEALEELAEDNKLIDEEKEKEITFTFKRFCNLELNVHSVIREHYVDHTVTCGETVMNIEFTYMWEDGRLILLHDLLEEEAYYQLEL